MINMMSQTTDKRKWSLLDPNVYKIAEVLLIAQPETKRLLNKEHLITLWGAWDDDEYLLSTRK
jgi:hypothetical protein